MRVKQGLSSTIGAALCCAALAAPAQGAPGDLVALGTGANTNTLYRFAPSFPGEPAVVPVTGLAAGFTLRGIDYRPATAALYGLAVSGNTASLYTIDPATGAAQLAGSETINAIAAPSAFGIDFNPVRDRLRVVNSFASDDGGANLNNFRLLPEGKLAAVDSDLSFMALPGGNVNAPAAGLAHDRNNAGATATTAFAILAGGDRLVRLGGIDGNPSPNGGALQDVGALGVDTTFNVGFDVDPVSGTAFAVLGVGGVAGVYTVNLGSGAATLIGPVGTGAVALAGLAVEPPPLPPPTPPAPDSPAPTPASTPAPPTPTLSSLSLTPSRFRTANIGGAIISAAKKAPVGSRVQYELNVSATVQFSVQRLGKGRKVGKRCVALNRSNRERKACRLAPRQIGKPFAHLGAAGPNRFTFTGRLGGKALSPGSYRLVGQLGSSTRSAPFTIVR
jgi:hypothetical protein